MSPMLLPDYLFYRLATPADRATGGSRAGLVVALLETLVFFLPTVWLLHHVTGRHWVVQHLNPLTGLFIALWVPMAYLSHRRYAAAHAYARLDHRWGKDGPQKRVVKLLAVLSVCVLFLGGAYRLFHAMQL